MSITVVIADDHLVVRRGLRALLESEADISVVAEAADGREALEKVEEWDPDVLVLDLVMPAVPGLEVLRQLERRAARTRVVILSMHSGEAYVVEALRAGAKAYVVKDASASELVDAVHHAAANRQFLSSPLSESRLQAYQTRAKASPDPYDALTTREREVLQLAAQGLTNPEIGKKLTISRRTAETHRANLLRKLGLKGQKDLIRYALRRGIVDL
jgi:DNA-binding NarL/FixJ family response regulator